MPGWWSGKWRGWRCERERLWGLAQGRGLRLEQDDFGLNRVFPDAGVI